MERASQDARGQVRPVGAVGLRRSGGAHQVPVDLVGLGEGRVGHQNLRTVDGADQQDGPIGVDHVARAAHDRLVEPRHRRLAGHCERRAMEPLEPRRTTRELVTERRERSEDPDRERDRAQGEDRRDEDVLSHLRDQLVCFDDQEDGLDADDEQSGQEDREHPQGAQLGRRARQAGVRDQPDYPDQGERGDGDVGQRRGGGAGRSSDDGAACEQREPEPQSRSIGGRSGAVVR